MKTKRCAWPPAACSSSVKCILCYCLTAFDTSYVQDHEDDGVSTSSNAAGSFPYLLALHALCCADASLAAPEADPQRFVRCLAPYVSRAGVQQDILSRTNSSKSKAEAAWFSDAVHFP